MIKTRKELKEAYKQMNFSMGVFQIKNVSNNRVLIDDNVDMESKWNRHKMELRFGHHKNRDLQKDWDEKGEDNFIFEILSELKQDDTRKVNYRKELQVLQQMIVDELNICEELRY